MIQTKILGLSTQSQRVLIIGAAARLFKACALLVAFISTATAAGGLPKPVRDALRASGIPPSSVGVLVQEAQARITAGDLKGALAKLDEARTLKTRPAQVAIWTALVIGAETGQRLGDKPAAAPKADEPKLTLAG